MEGIDMERREQMWQRGWKRKEGLEKRVGYREGER